MLKNRLVKAITLIMMMSLLLVGCGTKNEAKNPMQYVTKETVKADIEAGTDEYLILDVRKAEDFNKGHIKGAILADQDAANKDGDDATGIANLKAALKEATGSETGNSDVKYALFCYSGNSYAQKGTDLMIEMGIDKDQIYTLEGGAKDWEAGGDDYKNLLE